MIESLSVKNLALIESAEIEFGEGLNVFTGETGAGKSLVIGSVSLALGGRPKASLLRDGDEPAEIEMVFSVTDPKILKSLSDLDIPIDDDGRLIIRRKLEKGRSSARINGVSVTSAQLKEVSSLLLDLHAQSDHQSLLYEKNHLSLLDRYAGGELMDAKERYTADYEGYIKLKDEFEGMEKDEAGREREIGLLKFEIEDIKNASLHEGEDEELEDLFRMMNNLKKISDALNEVYTAVSPEGDGAAALTARALRLIANVTEYDKKAENLYNELSEIDSLLSDFQRELKDYTQSLDLSEEEFVRVTRRLDLINDLKQRYGRTFPEILSALKEREDRLFILENYEEQLRSLGEKLEAAKKKAAASALHLSDLRKRSAPVLSRAMEDGLKGLNFLDSRFEVRVEDTGSFGPEGRDRVYFLISTNPGEELKPLKDVASGGELSRIMLSLKTVLADTDEIETLIFDEIDTGISGRTAQKVSESLLSLSRSHQVILVTHLPQIAAMADFHYLISKEVEDGRTRTGIRSLDREEMVEELSRMLSGASVTERVMDNAREMKDLADKEKLKGGLSV